MEWSKRVRGWEGKRVGGREGDEWRVRGWEGMRVLIVLVNVCFRPLIPLILLGCVID